jgi:hypothetical protein
MTMCKKQTRKEQTRKSGQRRLQLRIQQKYSQVVPEWSNKNYTGFHRQQAMLYLKTCKQRCTTWLPLELTLSASTDSDNKVIKRCLSVVPETSNGQFNAWHVRKNHQHTNKKNDKKNKTSLRQTTVLRLTQTWCGCTGRW